MQILVSEPLITTRNVNSTIEILIKISFLLRVAVPIYVLNLAARILGVFESCRSQDNLTQDKLDD